MLFTPPHIVQYVPERHSGVPPVAEVIAGGSVRLNCPGGDVLCGPVGVVGAEPGDLLTVEVLGIGRSDGTAAVTGHPGVLGCAPSPATPCDPSVRASCRGPAPRAQVLLPVHVNGAQLSAGDLHFPDEGGCRTEDGWLDLRLHLTKRGMERFGVTEPVLLPITTSSLDATVAGLTVGVV